MAKMPVIAIVGRPNVGKSSLLNAMAGRLISIVQNMPGVTRDRISTPLFLNGRFVELVDTGGYGFQDPDKLTEHIREQIELAIHRADLVLFIVDCETGITAGDQEVSSLLRREGIKTLLVANKADGERADVALGDFSRLGLGTPIGVSAMNGRNIELLLETLAKSVDLSDAPTFIPDPEMMLAIVGKRNAGKSTLVNAIAGLYEDDPKRVIVSEVPGTTRDSVDVRFEKDGKALTVIDTAGVRKKRLMVTDDIAFYSFHRAERSIRRADIVLMLVDGTDPISDPDRKLGQYIAQQFKPVVLVVNKWDLTMKKIRETRKDAEKLQDQDIMEEFGEYLETELPWLSYAPVAFTTAKDGKNIQRVLDLAQHLYKQAHERLSTHKLNETVKVIVNERSCPTPSGNRLKVFYVTQTEVSPPTIVLFVNKPAYVTDEYQRYVLNRIRDLLPYPEVPIKLLFRARTSRNNEELTQSGRATKVIKKQGTGGAGTSTRPAHMPQRKGRPSGRPPKRR